MRWRCAARNHNVEMFDTELAFKSHMRDSHPNRFTEEQLDAWSRSSSYSLGQLFENCPFCSEDSEPLLEHVGQHLQYFALQSLPWPSDGNADCHGSSARADGFSTTDGDNISQSTTGALGMTNITLGSYPDPMVPDYECDALGNVTNQQNFSLRLAVWGYLDFIRLQHLPLQPSDHSMVHDDVLGHFIGFRDPASTEYSK
jgi:hypothetical protein